MTESKCIPEVDLLAQGAGSMCGKKAPDGGDARFVFACCLSMELPRTAFDWYVVSLSPSLPHNFFNAHFLQGPRKQPNRSGPETRKNAIAIGQ